MMIKQVGFEGRRGERGRTRSRRVTRSLTHRSARASERARKKMIAALERAMS